MWVWILKRSQKIAITLSNNETLWSGWSHLQILKRNPPHFLSFSGPTIKERNVYSK